MPSARVEQMTKISLNFQKNFIHSALFSLIKKFVVARKIFFKIHGENVTLTCLRMYSMIVPCAPVKKKFKYSFYPPAELEPRR